MKKFIAFALLITPVLCMAQTDCADIKQDKSRLKCYDNREKVTIEKNKEATLVAQQKSVQDEVEFKRLASIFVRDTQANLALAALQWQNFMDAPRSRPVQEILESNKKIQGDMTAAFTSLMGLPGKSDPLAEKIKDYFAAWGSAFAAVRPTSSDSTRMHAARLNGELSRMTGLADRLKMDL